MSFHRLISAEKARTPISVICDLLDVSRSADYAWATAPSDRQLTNAWLTEQIKEIHAANRGVYGAPRIHAELRMRHGVRVGRKRVARLMAQTGISGLIEKRCPVLVESGFWSQAAWVVVWRVSYSAGVRMPRAL
ncbi:IS3 family transposase [Conexibacter sp. CPCC 206217]|uniref:IS3 family transposase n=1 Tax=Conexibacter sp. CPCC 206217 TaxID=3064574 RepID=UPI00351C49CC